MNNQLSGATGELLFYNYRTLTHDRLTLHQAAHLTYYQGSLYISQDTNVQKRYQEYVLEIGMTVKEAMRRAEETR